MSHSFSRWTDDLIGDPAFRMRHPHFHRRRVPLALLDGISLAPLSGALLLEQQRMETRLFRGDPVPAILVDLSDADTAITTLSPGKPIGARYGSAPILAAARARNVSHVWIIVRYDSQCITDRWWVAAPELRITAC